MAELIAIEIGGELVKVPAWATEETQKQLLAAILGNSKADKKQSKDFETLLELQRKAMSGDKKAQQRLEDELKKTREEGKKSRVSFLQGIENLFMKVGGTLGGIFGALGKTTLALTAVISGVTIARFNQLGSALNDLTKTGLGFGDAQGQTTIATISKLNALGLSVESATQAMINNSRTFAVVGGRTTDLINSFQRATASGVKLGLSLEDSTSMFLDEMNARNTLLNVTNLSTVQQARFTQSVTNTLNNQLKYSQALGESVETLQNFADQLTVNNGLLAASIIRFSDAVRGELVNSIRNFGSAMRGLGGEGGGEIAAAVTEAAIGGAIGFSDAAVDMIAVLPTLSGTMNRVIQDFQNGNLNGAEAAEEFTAQLANLSEGERQRVFLLARAGDQTAKMMAQTIVNFEQANKRLEELGVDPANVQKGFNLLNTAASKLRGAFDGLVNRFVENLGENSDDVLKSFEAGLTQVTQSIYRLISTIFNLGNTADQALPNFKNFMDRLPEMIGQAASYLSGVIDGLSERIAASGGVWKALVDIWNTEVIGGIKGWWTNTVVPWWDAEGKQQVKDTLVNIFTFVGEAFVDAVKMLFGSPEVVGAVTAGVTAALFAPFKSLMAMLGLGSIIPTATPTPTPTPTPTTGGTTPTSGTTTPTQPPRGGRAGGAFRAGVNSTVGRAVAPVAAALTVYDTASGAVRLIQETEENQLATEQKWDDWGSIVGTVAGGTIGALFGGPLGAVAGASLGNALVGWLSGEAGELVAENRSMRNIEEILANPIIQVNTQSGDPTQRQVNNEATITQIMDRTLAENNANNQEFLEMLTSVEGQNRQNLMNMINSIAENNQELKAQLESRDVDANTAGIQFNSNEEMVAALREIARWSRQTARSAEDTATNTG